MPGAADRASSPTTMGNYVRKGGGHVVKILKDTRTDFSVPARSRPPQVVSMVYGGALESVEGVLRLF